MASFDKRKRALLLVLLAVCAWALLAGPEEAATPAAPASTAPQPRTLTAEELRDSVEGDSILRLTEAQTLRDWLGPERWMVMPRYGGDSVEMIEAQLSDSSATDLMAAFVNIPVLRDSAGAIELLAHAPIGRATLAGNVDSVARAFVKERMLGCIMPLVVPARLTTTDTSWTMGFVPGMVSRVAAIGGNDAKLRAEGRALLDAVVDSTIPDDSLRATTWEPQVTRLWRDGGVDILVASRRHASESGTFVHEQYVVAERRAQSPEPFRTKLSWSRAYDTDETRSSRIEDALRVGTQRRLVLLEGATFKEGSGGSLLIRRDGRWAEAVSWSSGC